MYGPKWSALGHIGDAPDQGPVSCLEVELFRLRQGLGKVRS